MNQVKKMFCLFIVVSIIVNTTTIVSRAKDNEIENVIEVETVIELENAIQVANKNGGNYTIIVQDGTYELNQLIHIVSDYITIKSQSGNYKDVTIKGKGMSGLVSHVFLVTANNFTIEGISLGEVSNHVIQVQGEKGASNVVVRNCCLYNAYEQLLKVSGGVTSDIESKNGLVENCHFEYTLGIGPQYYIGGIDAHHAVDWEVRNNTFKDIISPESSLAEHAIHFWSSSKNTLVENNTIIDCDRGIGFGLGSSTHEGGIIRNNYVYTSRDVGIGLENANNVKVYDNTVYTPNYDNSIEYRFSGTSAEISDNVISGKIASRNNGKATLSENIYVSESEWTIGVDELATYKEVPSNWATVPIQRLEEETMIKEDLYKDYQTNISRKDFAYLSVKLYEELSEKQAPAISSLEEQTFADTKDSYVLKAYKLGIINGYGNGLFGPEDTITREQVAVMLVKSIQQSGINLNQENIDQLEFKDQKLMSSWALKSIRIAYKHQIMNGVSSQTIAPKSYTTREQALVLVYNVLQQKGDFDTANPLDSAEVTITEEYEQLVIEKPILKWTKGGAYNSWAERGWYSTPAVADLDNDGDYEIIASAYSIVVLDAISGDEIWRVKSGHDRSESDVDNVGRTWSDIIVEDIDGDQQMEIISAHSGGVVSVYNHDGYFELGWPNKPIDRELRGLKVFDIDQDGTSEIIVTAAVGSKENIWVYEHEGSLRDGWPQLSNDLGYAYGIFNNNVSVGDLTGDGNAEIVVPSDVHYICAYDTMGIQLDANPIYGDVKWGAVGVWESLETERKGWGTSEGSRNERNRANFAHGASVIDDVNNDGILEVIAIGNVYDSKYGHPPGLYNGVFIFNADRTRFRDLNFNWETVPIDTGAPLSEDYNEIENNQPDPVVSDMDNDGFKEIIFSSYDGKIHCYSLDQEEHNNWPYSVYEEASGVIVFASVPEIQDLNNDGFKEVILTTWTQNDVKQNGNLIIFDYKGTVLFKEELPNSFDSSQGNGALASPRVFDIDKDGEYEIIINSINAGIIVYDVPTL